jgi:hypothetical protein
MSACTKVETGNQHLVLDFVQGSPDAASVYRRWHLGINGGEGQCGDVLSSNLPIASYYCYFSIFSVALQRHFAGTLREFTHTQLGRVAQFGFHRWRFTTHPGTSRWLPQTTDRPSSNKATTVLLGALERSCIGKPIYSCSFADQSVRRTAFSLVRFFPATSAESAPGPFSPSHTMSVLLCIQVFF